MITTRNYVRKAMRNEYVEISKCGECPFYTEFNEAELYACKCLLNGQIDEDDTKIMDGCPLTRATFVISLAKSAGGS